MTKYTGCLLEFLCTELALWPHPEFYESQCVYLLLLLTRFCLRNVISKHLLFTYKGAAVGTWICENFRQTTMFQGWLICICYNFDIRTFLIDFMTYLFIVFIVNQFHFKLTGKLYPYHCQMRYKYKIYVSQVTSKKLNQKCIIFLLPNLS